MIEQFVSAFDGYTPDGQTIVDTLTYPLANKSVIAVNVHSGDSLQRNSIASLIATYQYSTTTALIDRTYFPDLLSVPVAKNSYRSRYQSDSAAIVPVSVGISNQTYNPVTRVVTFTVGASFVAETKGDYRINAYILENNVCGLPTDTTYNGWNQLSFMFSVPWSPWFQKGYYLPAENGFVMDGYNYKHNWVLNEALDGAWGATGIIPQTGGTFNQMYSRVYTYTLPTAPGGQFRYNPDNIYLVGFVEEYSINKNNRTVLNSTRSKMLPTPELQSIQGYTLAAGDVHLFPNPTAGNLGILIAEKSFLKNPFIHVYDVLGTEVYSQRSGILYGQLYLNLQHLENGAYSVVLEDGASRIVRKLLIAR
jgi:hypothetical protein